MVASFKAVQIVPIKNQTALTYKFTVSGNSRNCQNSVKEIFFWLLGYENVQPPGDRKQFLEVGLTIIFLKLT